MVCFKHKLNFLDFKTFLINFGLVSNPENLLSPEFKLTHELWRSLSHHKPDYVESVHK